MDKSTIIARLREHEADLKASGVKHLSLFGSYARGTAVQAVSDVDLLADFDRTKGLTLFSLSGLRLQIMDILNMPVDLADRRMLKEQIKARAEREAVVVFKDPVQPLRDILESVRMIEDFTAGLTFDRFREDPKTVAAVERKLLVIGEAAVRLGPVAPSIVPDVPWRQIRDLGNLLRHAYDKVDLEIIWRTITDDLPPLKAAVLKVLETPPADS